MSNVQREFFVQGMCFRLKPTSKRNITALQNHFAEPSAELLAMDQYEQWIECLRVIAEPHPNYPDSAFDKIDVEEFDIKVAEEQLASFMPALTMTVAGLVASSRS